MSNADLAPGPICRSCKTAIYDGDLCLECWRDDRALAIERNREWWEE